MTFRKSVLLILLPGGALVGGLWGCGASGAAIFGVGGSSASAAVAASAASSGTTGVSSTGGAGGSGIGGQCLDDTQCAPGLSCIAPSSTDPVFGGGAPNGFCSQLCYTDGVCAGFGGVCYFPPLGQQGRCTLPCDIGPPLDGDAGADAGSDASADAGDGGPKCLGRDDVRCAKVAEGVDDCFPTCSSDAQCPGRICDPRTALCVDPPARQGAPTGTPCDASALADGGASNPCAGVCILFDSGNGMCSQPCVLGGAGADECGGSAKGLCVFHPDPNGNGDTGYCTNACTMPSDCNNPMFGCFGVQGVSSTNGYCFAATPCPNGDADCSGTPGYVCTSMPGGALCLDPNFLPAAPDAGVPEGGTDAGMDGDTDDAGADDAGDAGAIPAEDAGADDAGDAGASDVDGGP